MEQISQRYKCSAIKKIKVNLSVLHCMVEHHFIILHAVFHILKSTPMLIFFASGDVNMKLMLIFLPLSNIDS